MGTIADILSALVGLLIKEFNLVAWLVPHEQIGTIWTGFVLFIRVI